MARGRFLAVVARNSGGLPPRNSGLYFSISRLLREKYAVADASAAAFDVARLLHGEPLDYVIGWAPFLDATVDLSLHPFIPRPETEFWVRKAIEHCALQRVHGAGQDVHSHTIEYWSGRGNGFQGEGPLRVLDMFSGSGAIAVAWAVRFPEDAVVAAEREPRFVRQILLNRTKNGISAKQMRVARSDLFRNIWGRFDVILANPPYVGAGERLDTSVRKFEPRGAYYGGGSGLTVIRRFLREARSHLAPGGELWMEHGARQKPAIEKILKREGYGVFSFHRDQFGRWRYVVARI